MRPILIVLFALVAFAAAPRLSAAETIKEEAGEHPRIQRSIHELEETIKFLEAAPHDFGGHRADAVKACHEAIAQLRLALTFREDEHKGGEKH